VEAHDLAETHPERLREMVELWWHEAGRNGVLPLDDAVVDRFPHMYMPYSGLRRHYELRAGERILDVAGPMVGGGFVAVAELTEPLGDATGVVCEQGDWIAGWAWVLLADEVRYVVHVPSVGEFHVAAPRTPDATTLGLTMAHGDDGGVVLTHFADGVEIGAGTIPVVPPMITNTNGEFLTVGFGTGFPVSDAYSPPAELSVLGRLVLDAGTAERARIDEIIDDVMRHQ
jgi:arylsulfatase